MKKRNLKIVGLVLALSALMASSAFARWGGGYGMMGEGYDRGPGDCYRTEGSADVDVESVTKFRKETLQLRDNLLTRRLELSQELEKENPDADRIGNLRKEIIDIETGISKVADKYGIDGRRGERCGRGGSRGGYGCDGPCNSF
ncbi:MAG: hypothetical protein P1S46_12015 [bacterium]|nr:hypothetical protein [bacterium]MDT8396863.1 hypothetical protein [bacterium]